MSPWQIKPLSETLLEAKPGFACGEDPPEGVFQFRMNNITTEGQGVVALADESVKGFNIARAVARIPLAETTIVLSPIELQREFARRVGAVEKLKSAQRASLAELDALFATLQHRAFRGEL